MKLQQRFLITTAAIVSASITIGILVSNLVYVGFVKEQVDGRHIGVVKQFVNQMEDRTLSLADSKYFLESMSRLGYQIALSHSSGEHYFFGEAFDDVVQTPEMSRLYEENVVYHGMSSLRTSFSMMGHFSNKLENTVGMQVNIEGETWALFLRSTNNSMFREIHLLLVGFIGSAVIISVIGILLFSRKMIHSLSELTSATQEIAKHNFNYPLKIQGKDEIGQLADRFRIMQKKLANTDEKRRTFINNVSHDFQSPLLNILGYTELLADELVSDAGRQYNQIIQSEAKRLSNLTKQLLVLTSLDQGTYPLQKETIRLDQQLRSVVRSMMWRIQEKQLEIGLDLQPVELYGDKALLQNAWENLIINAIKYNREYGSVHIHCSEAADAIIVKVEDTGIGIEQEAIPHLMDRFFRVDKARDREGMGLGLAIVQESLSYHNATIDIQSDRDQGTSFTIRFPKSNL